MAQVIKLDSTTRVEDVEIDAIVGFHVEGVSDEVHATVTKLNKRSIRVKTEDGEELRLNEGEFFIPAVGGSRNMAGTLNKYRKQYVPTVSASGRKSLSNGDEVAQALEYLSHGRVMQVAEKTLGLEPGFLSAKYAKLNNGAKRMNSGNRIRAAIKRGDATVEDVKTAIKAVVAE